MPDDTSTDNRPDAGATGSEPHPRPVFDAVIVPLDGSEEAARALRPASAIAHYLDTPIRVVAYHDPRDDGLDLQTVVRRQVERCGDVERSIEIAPMSGPVGTLVAELASATPRPLVVMSTRGHGRSAAVLGSVANDILGQGTCPVLLIGPECEPGRFRLHGQMIVPIDGAATPGSAFTPGTLELARGMVETFDFVPQVVQVVDPEVAAAFQRLRAGADGSDLPPETATVHDAARQIGRGVDYTVLHDTQAGDTISAHAASIGATLIVMATHARRGLDRLRMGSVTARVVTHAPCPVLALAPES